MNDEKKVNLILNRVFTVYLSKYTYTYLLELKIILIYSFY